MHRYKGGGFLVGVPARNLTDEEYQAALALHGDAVKELYEDKPARARKLKESEVDDGRQTTQ